MTAPAVAPPALQLADLEVAYRVRGIWRPVLRGVSFEIAEGESYGLVGESGCGKSTAAFAIVRYLPRNGRVSSGSIEVAGEDLLAMSESDVRRMRSTRVSMVYQNPGGALNPTIRVGDRERHAAEHGPPDPAHAVGDLEVVELERGRRRDGGRRGHRSNAWVRPSAMRFTPMTRMAMAAAGNSTGHQKPPLIRP